MKRIAMWSGPRNISTAMMRSWESRSDTFVVDEPFYPYYLSKTNINHPGRNEIISNGVIDDKIVSNSLINDTKSGCSIHYQKHITLHLLPSVNRDWMSNVTNCFLIRNPKDMIISYSKVHSDLNMHLLGLNEQYEIFNYVKDITGEIPPVIDSMDILQNPRHILEKLCKRIGVLFSDEMLSWSKGKRVTDGIWAKYWYKNVINSTGFNSHKEKTEEVPNKYLDLHAKCSEIYKELSQYKII